MSLLQVLIQTFINAREVEEKRICPVSVFTQTGNAIQSASSLFPLHRQLSPLLAYGRVWTWWAGHLSATAAGVRSAQEHLPAQVSLAQTEAAVTQVFPDLSLRDKNPREPVPKLLHAQTFVATTFWVEFSSFPVFSTPTRLDFSEDKGTRTALKPPENNIVLFWPVRAFPLLTPFQWGHCIRWIQGVLTLKRKENLAACLSVKKERVERVTRGCINSSKFEIETPGFFGATSNADYEVLPHLFLHYAGAAPCT